mgnify:CR=1 FL=1
MLVHTVLFWMKKGSPRSAARRLADECRTYLRTPSVRHLWAGPPAGTGARDVIDATYDVGLTVVFDDVKGHDAYQVHPRHKSFIARNHKRWLRVTVMDVQA